MKQDQRSFASLSPNWQKLIRQMQKLNFGRIINLTVESSEPNVDGCASSVSEYRFGGDNSPRPELGLADFVLPKEIVALIGQIRKLESGRIASITIKHGLPFKMEVANPR